MPELRFFIEGFEAVEHALQPALRMRLRVVNGTPERIHAIWLRCQIQIEPARRSYSAGEAEKLLALFAAPERWGETLRPFLWQQVVTMVPGFTGTTVSEVLLPCTRDFSLAATQYCEALAEGVVPIVAQFSGLVLLVRDHGVEAAPISWELEARYAMPVTEWRQAMQALYGEARWLRLEASVFERLLAYRTGAGLPSWEQTIAALLQPERARREAA